MPKIRNTRWAALRRIGPGLITGAADDDPSSIATYSQTGAMFGYRQLWMAVFTLPFMITIQEMCGRIGVVTGMGLTGVIRRNYSKYLLLLVVSVLVIANAINIGADLGAMASVAQLFVGLPTFVWLFGFTAVILLMEVFVPYPIYFRFLKYLSLSLLTYFVTAILIRQDWQTILFSSVIPQIGFTKVYVMNVLAFFGTTISPYLFFWEADEEVEGEIERHELKSMGNGKPKFKAIDLAGMRLDTFFGMLFSNVITFFIIITAASTLHAQGITQIDTASQAALALRPLAGDFAFFLFAIGIIGTGLLAIPILAGTAAYAVTEAAKWKGGLSSKFRKAHGFYGVMALSMLVGLGINFLGIPPFKMLYYSAILWSFTAPLLLTIILLIGNNKRIMGAHTNSRPSNILGWGIAGIMTIASLTFLALQFT